MSAELPTVFMVDDDPRIRDALVLLLKYEGLAAEGYPSAKAFLETYRPERHGCLVLDMDLPGISGLELQKTLVDKDIHIPIIFLTGHADVSKTAQALKLGAIDLLEKPASEEALLSCIRKAIAHDAGLREAEVPQSTVKPKKSN